MLALIDNGVVVKQVSEGSTLNHNAITVSPAYDGWTFEGLRLSHISPADPAPEGKRILATRVELVGGVPKYVNDLDDILPPAVPQAVSRFQARYVLYEAGLLPTVEAAIGQADERVKMAWADAMEFQRYSPTIMTMAEMLNLSESQIDQLFIDAAKIKA